MTADELARLRRSDAVRRTHYLAFVRALLDGEGDIGAAAEQVGINRATFTAPLTEAVEHAELDLDDPLERHELHMLITSREID